MGQNIPPPATLLLLPFASQISLSLLTPLDLLYFLLGQAETACPPLQLEQTCRYQHFPAADGQTPAFHLLQVSRLLPRSPPFHLDFGSDWPSSAAWKAVPVGEMWFRSRSQNFPSSESRIFLQRPTRFRMARSRTRTRLWRGDAVVRNSEEIYCW